MRTIPLARARPCVLFLWAMGSLVLTVALVALVPGLYLVSYLLAPSLTILGYVAARHVLRAWRRRPAPPREPCCAAPPPDALWIGLVALFASIWLVILTDWAQRHAPQWT